VYFNVNFNVLFKLIKVHFLVSKLYIQTDVARNTCSLNRTWNTVCQNKYQVSVSAAFMMQGYFQFDVLSSHGTCNYLPHCNVSFYDQI